MRPCRGLHGSGSTTVKQHPVELLSGLVRQLHSCGPSAACQLMLALMGRQTTLSIAATNKPACHVPAVR